MKVVFANHEPFDPGRARALAKLRLVCAFARQHPVTMLSPDSADKLRAIARDEMALDWPAGLTAVRLPAVYKLMGLTINAVFTRALRIELEKLRPDVLWLLSDKLAAKFATRWPLIYEAHMIGTLYRQDRGASTARVESYRRMEQKIFDGAAGLAAINRLLVEEAERMFGWKGPSVVSLGAVEPSLFQPTWQGGDGRTVVYAGTMQFWKGIDLVLQAVALAPQLRLKLIGGSKPDEIARVKQAIAELKIGERVELTGRVPQRELPALLGQCACAVHALPAGLNISERLTSPLKVFEYMAVGVPVVASDVPSLREFLVDGDNARLFRAGDAAGLAAALSEVCRDGALAARLSGKAKADAQKYTYDARAANLLRLMRQVTATSAP